MKRRSYIPGEKNNLDRDFPEIENITGVVTVKPSFGGPRTETYSFTKSNLPIQSIHCENPVCNNGGIELGTLLWNLLSEMVENKQIEGEDSDFCSGYEKMGGNRRRDCRTTAAKIEVKITYKVNETK